LENSLGALASTLLPSGTTNNGAFLALRIALMVSGGIPPMLSTVCSSSGSPVIWALLSMRSSFFSMACAMKPQSDHDGNDWLIGRFTKLMRTSAVRGGLNHSLNIFCSAAVRHSRSVSRALVSALAYAA
jgi:hypothetical protein